MTLGEKSALNQKGSQRSSWPDLVRIFACCMVVVLHVAASNFSVFDVKSTNWAASNMYDSMVRSAVPLFFMLRGALFLTRETLDLKRFLKKNFATIALVYIVWTIFYAVIDQSQWFSDFRFLLSLQGWRKFAHSLASSHFHLWYLRALLVAYLLLPIIHAALHRGSVSLPYCLVVAVILVVPIFANEILAYGPSSIEEFVSKFPSSYLYYIAYMILGYALARVSAETVSRKRKILLLLGYVAAAAIAILLNYRVALAAGKATTFLYGNFSIPVIMEACCLFLFLRLAGENIKPTKQLAALSRATLGVYVLHPFFISLLGRNGISTDLFNAFVSIPVLAIAVLAMSVCVTLLLERIPYVRKIV